MVTSMNGYCGFVRYLLQQGASVNFQNQDGISPLHEACQGRHCEVIKILLSNDANVNLKDIDGETPLSLACKHDFIEIVDQLLCNGADINLQDSLGLTPIHKSISEGHIRTVQSLIERGCDINITSKRGDTPFTLACYFGDRAIVELFIKKGINRQQLQDGMQKACVKGYKTIISILLQHGAEINSKNTQGLSALHISCAQNNSDLVSYLFSKGALANIPSDDKQTPLHFAAKHLSVKCLSVLLENKAEINAVDNKERTALHYSLTDSDVYFKKKVEMKNEHERGRENDILQDLIFDEEITATNLTTNSRYFPVNNESEKNPHSDQEVLKKVKKITDILIENKIDLNIADIDGRSPIHTACSGNYPEIVKTLIHNKVNVNTFDKDNCNPLHTACEKCHFLSVQLLVKNGGNINATNSKGSSPLHLACVSGNLEIVTTLVECGANVNISDKTGSTSLHIAVKNTHRDAILFLISKGANVNSRDNDGFTALILCCRQNYKDVVEELLKSGADIDIEISEGLNALTTAITYHHYDICDTLSEKGSHLHERNFRYLLQCFMHTHDVCKFLDKYESTVNKYRNKEDQSLLHLATLDNNICWISSLLNKTKLLKALDNKGQTAFVYAIYKELGSIVKLFLERCTSGGTITADLQRANEIGHCFFIEKLFKIAKLHFGEFEIVFDSRNHDIVRKFMKNITCSSARYSLACDNLITEALKHGKYFDMYNILLAKLPDE
ncbi:ankyrin-1-like [Saccostrea echinata]|uniref:ankyrin-1-like n=1 Tax=Saccostrea echinata TaxID=191078 RepID=UPI002A80D4D6|nr:ankyrin-1-like [Saccostrea echinata]